MNLLAERKTERNISRIISLMIFQLEVPVSKDMMRFYGLFKDIEIVPQVEEQFEMVSNKVFMIPWGHIKLLIDKCHDNLEKFNFYMDNCSLAIKRFFKMEDILC